MAKKRKQLARLLGAKIVGEGAWRRRRRLWHGPPRPDHARPPDAESGRPPRPAHQRRLQFRPKVPMSKTTQRKLKRLAQQASRAGRKVSAMQLAAQLLEDAVASVEETASL